MNKEEIEYTIKTDRNTGEVVFSRGDYTFKQWGLMREIIDLIEYLQQENKYIRGQWEEQREELAETINKYEHLKQENKQLKEQVDRLIKKEYEKDNNYIVKVRTGEQLEREQYLLCFKSKSKLASMLIDAEDNWNKLKEHVKDVLDMYKKTDNEYVKSQRELGIRCGYKSIEFKMQDLEKGSENND